MAENEKLTRYLEAVDKVRAERTEALDARARAEIARELGMSDEDLAAARAEGEKDLERAQGFMRHAAWGEAIKALREAESLLPDDLRVLALLMKAQSERGDRAAAAATARRCLELDPRHEPSFRLLKSQEGLPRWIFPAFAVCLLAGVISAGIGLLGRNRGRTGDPPTALGPCAGQRYCEVDLPVRLAGEPLALAFPVAKIRFSPEDARLTLAGRVTHHGQTELELLTADVVLLDDMGREVGRLTVDAKPGFSPPLRDGDSQPFLLSEIVSRKTRALEIRPANQRTVPAPATYAPGTPVTLAFEPAAPAHFQLRAAYRSHQRRQLGEKTASEAILELTNTGTGIVRSLELEWRALDAAGSVVGKPTHETVVFQYLTPLDPGERRLVRLHLYVPGATADERVVITKVE